MSTLIVIAKEPVPGRVKTRLTPPFTPAQAAALARAALLDTLDAVLGAPADHRLLVLDGAADGWLPHPLRDEFTIVPQASGTLDARLAAAFAQAARIDQGPALLVGMDTPQLTVDVLTKGLLALGAGLFGADTAGSYADADAVFGPALDGGFWTLGLREPGHPRVRDLLIGVPMSRDDTGRHQHDRLVSAQLRISVLPTLRDVDHVEDAHAAAAQAPRTRFADLLGRILPGDGGKREGSGAGAATGAGGSTGASAVTDTGADARAGSGPDTSASSRADAGTGSSARARAGTDISAGAGAGAGVGEVAIGFAAPSRRGHSPSYDDVLGPGAGPSPSPSPDHSPGHSDAPNPSPSPSPNHVVASSKVVTPRHAAQLSDTTQPQTATWGGPVSSGYERALWQTIASKPRHSSTATSHASNRASSHTSNHAPGHASSHATSSTAPAPRHEPILLRCESGTVFHLDVAKYAAAPDATDNSVLDRCTGPTLDIGCGPGRLAAELARRGIPSLGVDVTPVALLIARAAGATALRRSVFDRLPGEGRWPYALLIDGNIGIGGDPHALLARIKDLLRPRDGRLLVETAAADLDERHELRLGEHGAPVPWASVGRSALLTLARPLGYRLEASWDSAGRSFTALAT